MGHQIEEHDTMLSVRETPWHKLGTVIPDYVSAQEAARLGGLTFEVLEAPVEYAAEWAQETQVASDHKVLYRTLARPEPALPSERRALTLGVVGSKYQVVQPAAMIEILETILEVAETPIKIETCGTLRNSKVGWFQVVMPEGVTIADDPHVPYLLIANSWDGSTALRMIAGQTRVVCANTLAWAIGGAQTSFSVRHTANANGRIAQARDALQLAARANDAFQREVQEMISTPFSTDRFNAMLGKVLPVPMTAAGEPDVTRKSAITRTLDAREKIMGIWEDSNGPVANIKGTAYGAVMAVSDYELWGARRKNRAEAQALSVIRGKQPLTAHARTLARHALAF